MRLVVVQVAPVCRHAGSMLVNAHSGLNHVRFRARVGNRSLAPGTYRLAARVPGATGRFALTIVVSAGRALGPDELAAARTANVCGRSASGFPAPSSAAGTSAGTDLAARTAKNVRRKPGAKSSTGSGSATSNGSSGLDSPQPPQGQVLAAQFTQSSQSDDWTRPFLFAAAAMAILLLGVAALSPELLPGPRLGAVVVKRRVELALAGASTLLVAVVAYLATLS